jgi:hypothetical protein
MIRTEEIFRKFELLYKGKEVIFDQREEEYRDRLLFVMELKMNDLTKTDKQIFEEVKQKFNVSLPTLLRDIAVVERMIANEMNPNGDPMKVFVRYFIGEINKEAIQLARDKNDPYTMSYATNIMGKHHCTDKEDVVRPPYDDIIPFTPILTFDPKAIGINLPSDFEDKKKQYLDKFRDDYQNFVQKLSIPDAEIVKDDGD